MVGICFGHQIVARALGARVEKFAGGWSLGAVDYAFLDPAETLTIMAFHQDQVLSVPAGARPIASSPYCRYAGFAYGRWALTIQPHPEFDAAYVQDLLDHYAGRFTEDRVARAEANMARPLATGRLVARMGAWLRHRDTGRPA